MDTVDVAERTIYFGMFHGGAYGAGAPGRRSRLGPAKVKRADGERQNTGPGHRHVLALLWGGENESQTHGSTFPSRPLYDTLSKRRRLPVVVPTLSCSAFLGVDDILEWQVTPWLAPVL